MGSFPAQTITLKDGSQLTLRSAGEEDAAWITDLRQQIAKETTHTLQVAGAATPMDAIKTHLRASGADPQDIYLGAFSETEAAGMLRVIPFRPAHPWLSHSVQFGMMVRQKYWGTGVSDFLMKGMLEHAARVGIHRIEATVRSENTRGVKFYERHGFVVEGTRRRAVIIDGKEADEFYIAKLL